MKSHWPVTVLSTFSSLVAMAMPLVLVRTLDPGTLGSFKIFFLYVMVLPPLTFISGITNGLSYWAGRGEIGLRAIRTSAIVSFLVSSIALVLMLGFRSPIADYLHFSADQAVLFSFAIFFGIVSSFFDEAAIATGKIWTGAFFYSGFEILRVAVIVVIALMTKDLTMIIRGHLAVQVVKTVCGYILSYRHGLLRLEWDFSVFKSVLRYASPVSLAFIFGLLLNYSDQIILSRLVSAPQFALYAICCLTVPPLLILETSLTRVLIPQLSHAFAEDNLGKAALLFRKAVQDLGFFLIPAAIGMMVFASPIIELLFTSAYVSGANYLRLYSLWYLALLIPQDAVARAQGQARWILGNFTSFSLVTVVLSGGGAFLYGPMGALVGLLLARWASRFYTITYMRRQLSCGARGFVPFKTLGKMASIGAVLGLISLVFRTQFSSSINWFLVFGGCFTTIYLTVAFRWVENPLMLTRKVLMLTPGLFIGGLEKMILNLSKGLKMDSDWQPVVLAYDFLPSKDTGMDLLDSFSGLNIPVRSEVKPPRFSFNTVLNVARHATATGATVIHTHDLGALIYGVLAKFMLFRKVRVVHTQHSFVHLNRSWKYRYYEKIFTYFVDSLVVVSEDTRRGYLELGVREKKLHIIENGVDFPEGPELIRANRLFRRAALFKGHREEKILSSVQADFWILYLARVHGRKGQDHALRLWAEFSPALRSRCALLFVGPETEPGEVDRLRCLLSSIPDSERVVFVGASQCPQDWIGVSDLFLSCSEFEGMPLAPIEAIGSGAPAVLSGIAGHEFLAPFANIYPPQSATAGAEILARLFERSISDDKGFRKECWDRSQAIRNAFTLTNMAKKYEKLYEVSE